jgi:hypothetical protein
MKSLERVFSTLKALNALNYRRSRPLANSRGGVVYLNLEPGDCYGDHTIVSSSSLVQVVICLLWENFPFCCFSRMDTIKRLHP